MQGRIPEETLAEIRDRAPIAEVVGGHVGLRKVGVNHKGLCPFHAEKTPSFTVNEERGIFHCFGCGAGGNVFTFLMRFENLTFPEAVERLASRYGVVLPERGEADPALQLREQLFRLNDKTASFFERYLWDHADAAPARAYLAERGIRTEIAERFRLGFSPPGGDVLASRLRRAGESLDLATQLGLVADRRSGSGTYDRFRARLMFPITDASGRIVGFGSRTVPGTASAEGTLPKYINSPETPLYRKASHLYGLAAARSALRDQSRVLVVEGYFDVLALVEAGEEAVVASLGTALTLDQLRLLKRFTRDIVVVFDGDDAGQKAAEKSLETFIEAGLWGAAAFLPAGEDPDTFVRARGLEELRALVAKASALLDFHLDRVVPAGSTVAERARIAPQLAGLVRKVEDPLEREMTIRRVADRLGVREETLRSAGGAAPRAPVARAPTSAGASGRASAGAASTSGRGASSAEELIVMLMLHDPSVIERVEAATAAAQLEDATWRAIAEAAIAMHRAGTALDVAAALARFPLDEAQTARLTRYGVSDAGTAEEHARMVDDCLQRLQARTLERQRRAVLESIRAAEINGDTAAVEEGLRRLHELRQGEGAPMIERT